jgi:serine/threonine protein kinase
MILSPLGSGGMGEVYKARDPRLNRLVAIKVLAPAMLGDAAILARFEREARILAGLAHPNIVAIHDVGNEDGRPFVVMELLEGQTLSALLTTGPVPQARAVAITLQIAKGLVAAHDKGIIHRDLKPSNVMIGKRDHTKLLDFGLAKELGLEFEGSATDALAIPGHTHKGTLLGTVGYMAPEQVRGEGVDARSDLFAVGVLLLEMLTGKQAFTGDSAVDVLHAILREDPLEGRELPAQLRPILERLLAKDPGERFQSAKDLAFVLSGLGSSASTQKVGTSPRTSQSPRSLKGVIAASILVGLVWIGWRWMPAPTTPVSHQLTWTQVTPRPAMITSARFSPDGRSIAYSAAGSDGLMEIFTFGENELYPRPTGQNGKVLALDRGGEIYFSGQGQQAYNPGAGTVGSLLRWKGDGTNPRVWIENVQEGDLAPDGQRMAVIRYSDQGMTTASRTTVTLESPPGKILDRSNAWLACPRWSPDGKFIAYIQHLGLDWEGQIVVLDLEGHPRFRSATLDSLESIAWSPNGQEIIFTTDHGYRQHSTLAAMNLKGRTRELLSSGQDLFLMDIDPRGRLLISSSTRTDREMIEKNGLFTELDFPLPISSGSCLSPDGSKVAFMGIEPDMTTWIYIRDQETNRFTRLTPGGWPLAFTPDNAWLLVIKSQPRDRQKPSIALVPFGPGNEILLNVEGLRNYLPGALPDLDHPIVAATLPDGTSGWFLLDAKNPPKQFAKDVEQPIWCKMVAVNSGSLWGYDLKRGLVHGTSGNAPWESVGGDLADCVPVAFDPHAGEIIVARRQQYLDPEFKNLPMRTLKLERLNPKNLHIRPDRTLKNPFSGALPSYFQVGGRNSVAESVDFRGHLFIVDGLFPSRSR